MSKACPEQSRRACPEQSRRTRIEAVSFVVALLTLIFGVMPAAAIETHENPVTAPLVYDGVALLQKYSQAVDYVPLGNTSGLELLRDQAMAANVPPELRTSVDGFLSSCRAVAALIPELQTELEGARTTLAQYRVDDARQLLASAKHKLDQAYAGLLVMDNTAADTGRWWKVESTAANSSLRQAYADVQVKLQHVRELLDLLDNMYSSMVQTGTGISLRSSNLSSFRPTNLSLVLEPDTAFVGDKITLRGVLSADGRQLEGRIITLLLDNAPVASILTNAAGAYQKEISIPFKYVPTMKVQAIFYPMGNDIGRYLGASSSVAALNVLFYQAALTAAQSTAANPGRDFLVAAVFNYGDNPALEGRNLSVYLDDEVVFHGEVGAATYLRLPVAAGVASGTHNLSFYAAPSGRYAPAGFVMSLAVNRVTPVIEVDAPGMVFLPFSSDIAGKVYSSIGPLKNARVEISLGDWKTTTATGDDGTFSARFRTGISLTLLGSQDMRIAVTPEEPWHKAGSLDVRVTVINPVNIAGILLLLTVPALLFALNRRRVQPLLPHVAPVPVLDIPAVEKPEPVREITSSGLLNLYRGVLTIVQAATTLLL